MTPEEIKAAGGQAMSNGGSVTDYDHMVEMVAQAKAAFWSDSAHSEPISWAKD